MSRICSRARSFVRSIVRSFVFSFFRFFRSFVRAFVRSFVRSFVLPFVRSFVVLSLVRSFVLQEKYLVSHNCIPGYVLISDRAFVFRLTKESVITGQLCIGSSRSAMSNRFKVNKLRR